MCTLGDAADVNPVIKSSSEIPDGLMNNPVLLTVPQRLKDEIHKLKTDGMSNTTEATTRAATGPTLFKLTVQEKKR